MPNTAFGNKATIKLDDAAGVLTAITGMRNSAAFEQTVDTDADLAFGERSDGHTIGLKEGGTINLGGSYSSGALRHMGSIWQSTTTKTLELNQAGEATGRRQATAETILTSLELSSEIGGTTSMGTEHKVASDIAWSDN